MRRACQALKGVARLEDCYEDDECVFLVLEACRGGDLKQYVEARGPLNEQSLAKVAHEVFAVIHGCHDIGILYSDVKVSSACTLSGSEEEGE